MKKQRIPFTLIVLIACIGASVPVRSQNIKLLKDSITATKSNARLIYGEDRKVYCLSFQSNPDFPILIEQLNPAPTFITQLSHMVSGCAIYNNKMCVALNDPGSNFPRVIISDIVTGNTLLDTTYSLHKPPYFSFSAQRIVADSVGNFYVNLYLFDSTQQRSASHMRIKPTGEMSFRSCDSITFPETALVRATENECTYAIWAESAITVSSNGAILHVDSFPIENAAHWVVNGYYTEGPEINGSKYYTLPDRFTGYGMVGKVKDGRTTQTYVHLDTMLLLTNVIVTNEEGLFLVGKDSLDNTVLSQQTKEGVVIADTIIPKLGGELELLLSQVSYENQDGSITVMQNIRDSGNIFNTRFLNFGRVPHAPAIWATVTNQELKATIHWNVPLSGGLPITSYLLQYKKHTDVNWNTPQTILTDSFAITNLIEAQEYDCRIQVINELGASMYSKTITFKATGTVGLSEHEVFNYSVYPNPVKAGGHIHSTGSVDVYDLLGNKVSQTNVAPHVPGIYIIHITQDSKEVCRKLIVE